MTILKPLNQLKGLRIFSAGTDAADLVVVWMKPGGHACSAFKYDRADPEADVEFNYDNELDYNDIILRSSDNHEITNAVCAALNEAGFILQDFRVCGPFLADCPKYELLPASLRILHLEVIEWDVLTTDGDVQDLSLMGALAKMPNLEDLTLILQQDYEPFKPSLNYQATREEHSEHVFRAVENAKKLRRVALEGEWAYSQASLIKFVKQHASSLRCLILYGGILNGFWVETLQGVADLTRNHLQYLSVTFM